MDKEQRSGVRFTIPDKSPQEQLKMARDIREIMITFAKVTGEEEGMDLSQADAVIAKLEAEVAALPEAKPPTHTPTTKDVD